MDHLRKHAVLGVGISATSYGEIVRLCRQWLEAKRRWQQSGCDPVATPPARSIFLCSVHPVMMAAFQPEFRAVLNGADAAAPDGMPLAWALRSFGVKGQQRVYGPDLMLALCAQAAELGHRVFLYGGREETLSVLCRRLTDRFPGLVIAGTHAPPFRPLTPEEDAACVERIVAAQADIVFVGIGAPKQERWIADHCGKLPGAVLVGVGAAFDFHAGRVRQAPRWMQQAGLEWFFRLMMEPGRLWKRYLLLNPLFLTMWTLQKAGILRYEQATLDSSYSRTH